MSRDNARNTEHAWRDRAAESGAHQAAAAGQGPPPGLGGVRPGGGRSGGNPVYVTGASSTFLDQVAQAWGIPHPPSGAETRGAGALDPVVSDQRAITELSRQINEDLRVTASMVLDTQANAARAMTSLAQDMRTIRQEERDHMQQLLDMMSSQSEQQLRVAESIQAAYGGVGAVSVADTGGVTSGSPSPRRARAATGGPAAGATPTGAAPGGAGGGGGGGGPRPARAGRGTQPPRYHPITLRGMRRNFFQGANQQFGLPAAAAAGIPPTVRHRLITSVAGPMGSVGMRGIPVLGAGIAAVNGLFDAEGWLTEQRAANAQYQQIYSGDNFGLSDTIQGLFGGDVNTGSGQRAAGFNFRMSQLFTHGGLTGSDSDKLFQGVSSLGYNNDQRRDQLQFATGMYKKQGMSVDDSLRLIQTSAQYANQSLAGVAEGLTQVSRAAQVTGQSAKVLRDQFTSYYGAALKGGAGASAAPIAQAMTLSTSGITRQLAGANMTPMLTNPMYMQQIASGAGMTSGQLQSQMAQGNFMQFAGSAQKILDQRMLGVMDPGVRRQFNQLVKEYGGNKVVAEGPGAISAIATELMANKGWNVYAARSALQSIGVDTSAMNDQQVAEFFVAQTTSGGMGAQAKDQQEKNKPKDVTKQIEEHGVSDFARKTTKPGQLVNTDKARTEYLERQKKTGKSDPAMEAAITQFGSNAPKVKVQTKQGQRVVTMGEAIRDYGDQISSGTAIIAEGEYKGKKISEVTGVTTTGVVPGKGGVPNTAKENAKSGQSAEEFDKEQKGKWNPFGDNGEGGGVIRVEPSPELARLFNFSTTGNITVEQSAAQGVPPTVNGPVK